VKKVAAKLSVIGCLCLLGATAHADEGLRVGVIDVRKVLIETKPGQQYRVELEKMVKERRDKLGKDEAVIKSLQEKFEKDKLVLSDQQKEQKKKEIDDKIVTYQKAAQEADQEVKKRDHEILDKASAAVNEIVAQIAKQEKLAMVVERNQTLILWLNEPIDITERVAKAYEAKAK